MLVKRMVVTILVVNIGSAQMFGLSREKTVQIFSETAYLSMYVFLYGCDCITVRKDELVIVASRRFILVPCLFH